MTVASTPILAAFFRGDVVGAYPVMEVIIASFLVALTAATLFLTARRFLLPRYSAAVAMVFAFATSAWSTGSRAVQHTPSMLLIASRSTFWSQRSAGTG